MDKTHRHRCDAFTPISGAAVTALLGGFLAVSPVAAQERFKPAASAVVLSASVHAAKGRPDSLRALDQAWRAQPQNLPTALAYARAVFTLGLTEGDLRWYGSAKAALKPWWTVADLPAEAYFLRGLVKQGFHDFQEGLQDINRAIALEPARAEFWSWRFALHLLLADMSAAQKDIEEMGRLLGAEEADVYRAVLLYRTGQPLAAVAMLSRALRSASYQDPSS